MLNDEARRNRLFFSLLILYFRDACCFEASRISQESKRLSLKSSITMLASSQWDTPLGWRNKVIIKKNEEHSKKDLEILGATIYGISDAVTLSDLSSVIVPELSGFLK